MTAKLYYSYTNKSYRLMKQELIDTQTEFATQDITEDPISWEQLLEVLMHTDNGIEDLLSPKSLEYKTLIQQGVDFEELTLTQFHSLVVDYPRIIRSPILVVKDTTLIGYGKDDMSILKSREERTREHKEILSMLHSTDVFEYDLEMV